MRINTRCVDFWGVSGIEIVKEFGGEKEVSDFSEIDANAARRKQRRNYLDNSPAS